MVRATFAGFSTAVSALQANQKRLDIIGQNLSNMNTPGYTRQSLETSSLNYRTPVSNYMNGSEIQVGFGVRMDRITQIRDPYLDVQYRNQMQKSGLVNGLQTSLDRLSNIFDESNITGIQKAFVDISNTLLNMQDVAKINDSIYETELRSKMKALTNLLNNADLDITEAERQEFLTLDGSSTTQNGAVEKVNDMLQQIGSLNRQIKQNQIHGQPSLELQDERNLLLDELSSYIPIEVTYYKDRMHDGIEDGMEHDAAPTADMSEDYYLDGNGKPLGKKEWPDDLRVEMLYTDKDGITQRLTLVEGTEGKGEENYGRLELTKTNGANGLPYPDNFTLTFHGSQKNLADAGEAQETLTLKAKPGGGITDGSGDDTQLSGGSIHASLEMLWKTGNTDPNANNDIRGYEYYRQQIDTVARSFASIMNEINIYGTSNDPDPTSATKDRTQVLFVDKTGAGGPIKAGNIGINSDWVSGRVHVSSAGDNPNDTILYMWEAMSASYPCTNPQLLDIIQGNPNITMPELKDNSFSDFMNHIATTVANDSYTNQLVLKNNVTVLNAVQNSRDSISGVSLDEEGSNMMMYQAAYNAASRLMTALDEVLNTLINSTGVCGR